MVQLKIHMHDFFIFKPSSQLHTYINKRQSMPKLFPLYYLIFVLKNIFKNEQMYDVTNHAIVISSAELENILNKKFIYIRELCENLIDHIVRVPEKYQRCVKALNNEIHLFPELETEQNVKIIRNYIPGFVLFSISLELRNVFKTLTIFNDSKTVFCYSDLLNFVSRYILINHAKLLDPSNPKIAYVKNDLLGKAFRVDVFHRGQVSYLLKRGNTTKNV